ncbi:hypothetical protein GTA08_BOTSDO07925 [Botryosphaeria dothidea]|uniref:Uncharacterized protein n=1 Tax=Botryosphaeria dothidea TaxID=55169 RepID=A0A8H4INN1_9PEZI|nr:hypothetical protein GTA08_BOTSDO07925 [Botryosphaeria dothidea]
MDLRLPRTDDSTYSPHSDATPPSLPPPANHVSPENLTANDRVASYKPAHRPTSQSTKRSRHAPSNSDSTTDSSELLRDNMASQDDTYDFLESSGVLVPSDDDGAETVSSGSFAMLGPNLEETHSVNGDEDEHISDDEQETPEPVFQPSDSGLTTRPDIRTPEASTLAEKPRQIVDGNKIHIFQPVVRSYGSQWAGMSGNSVDELRYSIAKENLDWAGPFRILFAGFPFSMPNDIKSSEHMITEKLAAALSVGQPESQTVKTHTTGVRMSSFGSDVVIKEIFSYDDQTSDMFTKSIPTALPNLVVICSQSMNLIHLEDENLMKLQAVMEDRGVPILNIALSSPVGGRYSFSPDNKSLRICLKSGEEELSVEPVDLNTFLNLDDAQLNRHLLCIGVGSDGEEDDMNEEIEENKKVERNVWFKKSFDHVQSTVRAQPTWALLVVGFLLSSMVAVMVGGNFLPGSVQDGAVQKAEQVAALNSAIQTFTGTKTDVSVIQRESEPNTMAGSPANSRSNEVLSKDTASKSVSIVEHPFSPRANDSENFKLHIIGDYHFVVTPPKSWASFRKSPKLSIRIQRGAEEVPFTTEKLVDGVHAVRVEPKDAYGTLNVTISTGSRPRIQQSLTVDFGSPWLKMSSWAGMMKTDVALAQQNAKNTSLALFKGLELFRETGKNITDVILHSANSGAQKALQLFNETFSASTKLHNECRGKHLGMTSAIINAAKQVDLAKPVNRARRNAKRIANKLSEKTKALRSKGTIQEEEKPKGRNKFRGDRTGGKKARP